MAKYLLQERLVIVQKFYENGCSFVNTFRALRVNFGQNNCHSVLAIRRIVEKFHDVKTPVRQRNVRTVQNVAAVKASVAEDSNLSIPCRAQELGLKKITTANFAKTIKFTPV